MRVGVAVLLGCTLVASAVPAADAPLAPLSRLAGHCWKGEFAEGGSWDRHCFEWAYDGKFLHDKHVVTADAKVIAPTLVQQANLAIAGADADP